MLTLVSALVMTACSLILIYARLLNESTLDEKIVTAIVIFGTVLIWSLVF